MFKSNIGVLKSNFKLYYHLYLQKEKLVKFELQNVSTYY